MPTISQIFNSELSVSVLSDNWSHISSDSSLDFKPSSCGVCNTSLYSFKRKHQCFLCTAIVCSKCNDQHACVFCTSLPFSTFFHNFSDFDAHSTTSPAHLITDLSVFLHDIVNTSLVPSSIINPELAVDSVLSVCRQSFPVYLTAVSQLFKCSSTLSHLVKHSSDFVKGKFPSISFFQSRRPRVLLTSSTFLLSNSSSFVGTRPFPFILLNCSLNLPSFVRIIVLN
ncbi:hypothetical protein GEMRC1_007925 [Eukaryota sp. GEM-RC1]